MKVWVTKYALTKGIQELEAESCAPEASDMIRVKGKGSIPQYFHGEGRDWHRDKRSAKERALAMVAAKIRSLDKQRSKLLRFNF